MILLTTCLLLLILVFLQPRLYRDIPIVRSVIDATSPEPAIPIYKPVPEAPPPIVDNFPRAASAKSSIGLPSIPAWNLPPEPHVNETTPLLIGFTRNWRVLQQAVVSYITAGWPAGDIYVVENTGTLRSNRDGLLSLQNPFYIDYHRLTAIFGVNVITTPTLLTFAQLQNFYIHTALEKGWEHYFWGHMDVVVVSDEEYDVSPYQSVYTRAVDVLRESIRPEYGSLATRWFAYDRLALVRTKSFVDVGGWDTLIPFYMTDCDMHERLWMRDFKIEDAVAGKIWDVATSVDDLEVLYQRGTKSMKAKRDSDTSASPNDTESATSRNSPMYQDLLHTLDDMQHRKNSNADGRNTWQARQRGGQGEPFYRDAEGFEKGIQMTMELGRKVFEEKWGRGLCNIREVGLVEADAWRVVVDWENPDLQKKAKKEREKAQKGEGK